MDMQIIAVGAGVLGAAVGALGALAGAMVTRKGSQEQAQATYRAAVKTAESMVDAAVTTAESGYRAAVTASDASLQAAVTMTRAQHITGLESLNRAAQRTAYVTFIDAAIPLRTTATDLIQQVLHMGNPGDAAALDEPLRSFQRAHASVQLEGPPTVITSADAAVASAENMVRVLQWVLRDADDERVAADPLDMEAGPTRAALRTLREIVFHTPAEERSTLNHSFADACILEGRTEARAVVWLRAYEAAEQLLAARNGPFYPRSLLRAASENREPLRATADGTLAEFTDALSAFVDGARSYLQDLRLPQDE